MVRRVPPRECFDFGGAGSDAGLLADSAAEKHASILESGERYPAYLGVSHGLHGASIPNTLGERKMLGLGIDVGYENCGLSYLDVRQRRVVDHQTLHTSRSRDLTTRFYLLNRALSLALSRPALVFVGYESPFKTGKAKQMSGDANYNPLLLMRVVGQIESLAYERGLALYEWEPQKLKAGVIGKGGGRADKEQVRNAVERMYGIRMNEHEADATAAVTVSLRRWQLEQRLAETNA